MESIQRFDNPALNIETSDSVSAP